MWRCLLCGLFFTLAVGQDQELRQTMNQIAHTHSTRCCGQLTGMIENVANFQIPGSQVPNTQYYAFRGIPYARPPQRLVEPELLLRPTGIDNAMRAKPACPRPNANRNGFGTFGRTSEDCLYLNIFTKNLKQSQRTGILRPGGSWSDMAEQPLRAVIVFLAGFETEGGAPELGAEFIMREDIVVVTLEYRSGILGFLSDGTKYLPGNLGLEDVRVALGWVQQNIGDFGGDPGKVTVAGHGQGATIAHLLALNPTTSGCYGYLSYQKRNKKKHKGS